jgi:hypothetical protein
MGWTVQGSNPCGGEIYAPVQTDPGNHPAHSRGKSGRGVAFTIPPSNAKVKEWVELYLYSPSVLSRQVID